MRVIITGAGRGFGFELAKLHAEKGDRVYALAHSLTEELSELAMQHKNVNVFTVELTDEESVKSIFNNIDEPVDTIYNVAGIWYPDQATGIDGTDMEKVKKLFLVNAVAPLQIMKYGKSLLKDNAMVLNVSSDEASIGEPPRDGDYGYSMSKVALNMASMKFASETRDKNISVYCYHPGWMRTQMGGEAAKKSPDSISPEEAAKILYTHLYVNKDKIAGMYFDYTNRAWKW